MRAFSSKESPFSFGTIDVKLFNNIDQHQRGGVNFSELFNNLNSFFNGKSKSDSLNDAIKNMETNDFNNEDNIEDNIVYNFANAIGFEENDEKKLTINYKKYNKFIKDYKIFDYEEYTKNIVINYENNYSYLNKLEQAFSSKTNIFSLIKKIIIKYNEIRFYIFNNYFRLEIIKTSETSETSETPDKKKYELYFNNDKFDKIIKKYNIPDVNDIHEYIKKIEDYFKDEIKNIIKELKENILNNNNLLTFPDEEELEKGEKGEKREEGKSRGEKEEKEEGEIRGEGESEEEAVEIGKGEGEGEESRKVEGESEGEEREGEEREGEEEERKEELGKGEEEKSKGEQDKLGGKKYKKYKSSSKKHKKKQKKYNKTKKKNKKKITRKRY